MRTEFQKMMSNIMSEAWCFVKKNGYNMSEALQIAWRNYKLHQALVQRIVKFYFTKVDGSIREAYGTLQASMLPPTTDSGRRPNASVQVYFDTEKGEYRCFKKANLLSIAR